MILNILKREGREEQAYARFNVYSSSFTSFFCGNFFIFSGSSSYRSGQAGSQVSPANESSTGTSNPYFPKVKQEPNYYLLFVNCFCVKDRITELVQIKIVEHSI